MGLCSASEDKPAFSVCLSEKWNLLWNGTAPHHILVQNPKSSFLISDALGLKFMTLPSSEFQDSASWKCLRATRGCLSKLPDASWVGARATGGHIGLALVGSCVASCSACLSPPYYPCLTLCTHPYHLFSFSPCFPHWYTLSGTILPEAQLLLQVSHMETLQSQGSLIIPI